MNVLFVCVGNSGRSVMAEHLFRRAAGDRHSVRSAGSAPRTTGPEPVVVEAMREIGVDVSGHIPRKLDADALAWADVAVSVCADEVCPVTPGVRRVSWAIADPWGEPIERVREIRDEIAARVDALDVG